MSDNSVAQSVQLKVGDVVRLRSGGRFWTVERVASGEGYDRPNVGVVSEVYNEVTREWFHAETLDRYVPDTPDDDSEPLSGAK
jgi:uncharacterized protein YodC (DUF2158 family)